MNAIVDIPKKLSKNACPRCWKPEMLCVCKGLEPWVTRTRLLILQHPQEVRNPLGSARLLSLSVQNSVHRIGLSWRSLNQALQNPTNQGTEGEKWGVLYLGTRKSGKAAGANPASALEIVSKSSRNMGTEVDLSQITGIVLLDGNWKQSKSLWWRNPWLKKLPRLMLFPPKVSRYGTLRREPRRNSISTLEAASVALQVLETQSSVPQLLDTLMERFVTLASDKLVGEYSVDTVKS